MRREAVILAGTPPSPACPGAGRCCAAYKDDWSGISDAGPAKHLVSQGSKPGEAQACSQTGAKHCSEPLPLDDIELSHEATWSISECHASGKQQLNMETRRRGATGRHTGHSLASPPCMLGGSRARC